MTALIGSVWRYRGFIVGSVKNEFLTQFASSRLGGLWMILNPLAQVAIYALVLSAVLSAKMPGMHSRFGYAIYLMAGMLGWNLFNELVVRCLNVFIANANLIKKLSFPRLSLPLIAAGSTLVTNVLLFVAMFVVFTLMGHWPSPALLWLPLLTALTVALALGLGLLIGIVNVFIRDVGQIMGIVLQFWFWLTPVVYAARMLPKSYQEILLINPMTAVVEAYHAVLVYGHSPDLETLIYPALLAVLLLALSWRVYRSAAEDMADVL